MKRTYILRLLFAIFLAIYGTNHVSSQSNNHFIQYVTKGTGDWEDRKSWAKLTNPKNDPFDGILSSGSYQIEGIITRNGDIQQYVDLLIDGTLNIKGSFTNTSGKLIINHGAVLRIFGDYSMNSNIEVKNGGTLIVYGNLKISGGNVDFKGDIIVGKNFIIGNAGATLYNRANLIIGGNFTYTSGSFNIQGGPHAVRNSLYILDPNASIITPAWNNDICNANRTSCYYGEEDDFATHEQNNTQLLNFVKETISSVCSIKISSQPRNQTVCIGNNAYFRVEGSGISSYQWQVSNGRDWTDLINNDTYNQVNTDSLVIINANESLNRLRYRCMVSSSGSCKVFSSSATLNVLHNQAPEIISATPASRCGSGRIELKATASAGIISWFSQPSGGRVLAIGNSLVRNITSTTTFYVGVTNRGCSSDARTPVLAEVKPFPGRAGMITGTPIVCQGSKKVYSTTSINFAKSYKWTYTGRGITLNVVDTTVIIDFSMNATSGSLIVSGVNDCGIGPPSVNYAIRVNAVPTASISGPSSICQEDSATLTATGGTSYLWNNGATTPSITVNPMANTNYNVTVSNAFGCTDTTMITVAVNVKPIASISGITTIRIGKSTSLTATGGTEYLWSNGEISPSITINPITTTNFSVTVSNAFGCIDTANVTVTVVPGPVGSISGTTSICIGQNTTLTASGADYYRWYSGQTTASIVVNPDVTTEYTVIVTDTDGYSDTVSAIVTVFPLPIASIAGSTSICKGERTILTASGGKSYEWNTGDTTSSVIVNPVINTSYLVTVTDIHSCSSLANINIAIKPALEGAIKGPTAISIGQTATLTAIGGTGYIWSTGETTQSINVSPQQTTVYWVLVSDEQECPDTVRTTVYVTSTPGEVPNDDFENALIIFNPSGWNSNLMAYTTIGATSDGNRTSCTKKRPVNNVWFRFKATTTSISVILNTGGIFGTLGNPVIALFDASGNELACNNISGQTIIKLNYKNIEINKWYYISVDNTSGMAGTFTLGLNNNVNPGNIYYAVKDGDWNSDIWSENPNATEGSGIIPTENDIVYIRYKHVTVSATVKAYSVYITLGETTSLTVSPGAKINMKKRMYISNN